MAEPAEKKQRAMAPDATLSSQFEKYAAELDATNEKRERLVKASRDATISSKKVIFLIHRINEASKQTLLEQAERDLAYIRSTHISRIARELQGIEYWKLRRAYSPGLQEFVEAATLVEYCKTGKFLTLENLNKTFLEMKDASATPFIINVEDYLLGVGDLMGELMRLAISGVANGQRGVSQFVCSFVQALYEGFSLLFYNVDYGKDMNKKMETMLQNLVKIETTCYSVHVRGSEYPESMIVDSLEQQDIVPGIHTSF
ncbi:hypothetical protein O6H91_06G031000 [Diphasiastrum complanatum]|uniref:Uncharacterized protein n=3 Tax=Diphasiastrum complanatum TaxID=34168 RepID=A0ACC2DC70_DIPCM|nr:hypothetical protein O6H91_06G031000 [Diphasiastrum complanatum]